MMTTDDLIERIARDAVPVTPLRRPTRTATAWVAGAVVYFAALVLMRVSIADVSISAIPVWLMVSQVAAIATAATAAAAAFALVIPGESRRVLLAPLAMAALWLGSLVVASLQAGPGPAVGTDAQNEWLCVGMIAVGSLVPLAAMVHMLRRGAPLAPGLTMSLAVLSASALANVGACVSHAHTNSTVLLLWHGVTIVASVIAGLAAGRWVLRWDRPVLERRLSLSR